MWEIKYSLLYYVLLLSHMQPAAENFQFSILQNFQMDVNYQAVAGDGLVKWKQSKQDKLTVNTMFAIIFTVINLNNMYNIINYIHTVHGAVLAWVFHVSHSYHHLKVYLLGEFSRDLHPILAN